MTGHFFPSIKARLFLWLAALALTLLSSLGFFLQHEIESILSGSVDRLLHSKIQIIKGLIHEEHGSIGLELSEIIAGDYSVPRSGHYYKVLMDGQVIAYSPSLVDRDFNLEAPKSIGIPLGQSEIAYLLQGPDGEPIRVAKNAFMLMKHHVTVFAAESIAEDLIMQNTFRKYLFLAMPLSILLLCGVGFLIIRDSLKPLSAFSSKIAGITHKTMTERIDTTNEALELQGVADSFNAMLARLQKAFDAEQRLIADASHQLKTPVAVIRAQCDVTVQRDRDPAEYKEALQSIRSASTGIMQMIQEMLSLARLDSGLFEPPKRSQVSIKSCLDTVLGLIGPTAEKNEVIIGITCEDDLTVQADESHLAEALLAVIENAVKYSRRKGHVLITAKGNAGRAIITVQDHGIGILSDNRERIFERFYRGDEAMEIEGTGLGLSIARTIIEAHGGKISADCQPEGGTLISIVI